MAFLVGGGSLVGIAGLAGLGYGLFRLHKTVGENKSLKELVCKLYGINQGLTRQYAEVYREKERLQLTKDERFLEIIALRDRLHKSQQVQECLWTKVRASQDPVSGGGNPSTSTISGNEIEVGTSTISGNEIEVVQVEPLRITIASPYEPYLFPDSEFWVLLLLLLAAIAILIFVFSPYRRLIFERVWLIWLWLSPPSRLNASRNSRKMGHFVLKTIMVYNGKIAYDFAVTDKVARQLKRGRGVRKLKEFTMRDALSDYRKCFGDVLADQGSSWLKLNFYVIRLRLDMLLVERGIF